LGATLAGLAPILLPLAVSHSGSAAQVGLVMAAFNLGGLAAPFWGNLADRYRLYRWLLFGGLLLLALALLIFAFTSNPVAWLGLALVQGVGAAAASTVANLFIVESHPRSEWDERIGWLQTFYGAGQVVGLLLAGVFGGAGTAAGLLVASALVFVGAVIAWLTARTPPTALLSRPVSTRPAHHGEWAVNSPQRLYHHLNSNLIKKIDTVLSPPFSLFLTAWFLSFVGVAAVFALYPVLMQRVYGIGPELSSLGFAIAAGIGLFLYTPAGAWTERLGPASILRLALGVRLLASLILLILGIFPGNLGILALAAFAFIVLAWSLQSVGGTAWTASLSSTGEGEGLGVFNAATALASVIGAVLGGWVAGRWGYAAIPILAVVGLLLGLLLLSINLHKNFNQAKAEKR
jgi:DHA1 family tetracycline resistance protein-like MFS transporter